MADKADNNLSLLLDGLDQQDFDRFQDRLDELYDIVNKCQDYWIDEETGHGVFKLQVDDSIDLLTGDRVENFLEVRVSISEMKGAEAPVIKMAVTHTNFEADYAIHDIVRSDRELPDVGNIDQVLDIIEMWLNLVNAAFTENGFIAPDIGNDVRAAETDASEILNALVHAYVELTDATEFVVGVQPMKPYGPSKFYQIHGEELFQVFSPETISAIDAFMPDVVKLHYSANNSVTHYWFGPDHAKNMVVSAKTFLPEDQLKEHLLPLIDVPAPHLLEVPIKINFDR